MMSDAELTARAGHTVYSGECRGGPLDGRHAQSRFVGGFYIVDSAQRRYWVYDYDATIGVFRCRDERTQLARWYSDSEWLLALADGSDYDVRAYDPDLPDEVT